MDTSMLSEAEVKPSKGGVTWDEVTIAEHDKDRGTRTRITEPKTPFRPNKAGGSVESVSDDEGVHEKSSQPSAVGRRIHLGGQWDDLDEDHAAHDEWEAFAAASSPSTAAHYQHQYYSDGDDAMNKWSYDSGSEGGTRPSSAGSDASRRHHHARFSDGIEPGSEPADNNNNNNSNNDTAPLAIASPAKTDAVKHKEFESRRKAHYSHEFDRAKGLNMKALLSSKALIDEEEEEEGGDDAANTAVGGLARPSASLQSPAQEWSFSTSGAGHTPWRGGKASAGSPLGGGAVGFVPTVNGASPFVSRRGGGCSSDMMLE